MSFVLKNGLFKLNITDYHAILGVPLNADTKQIRFQYLKIAQKLHPDTCKADQEKKQLASDILSKLVNPAYKQISHKNSYAEYHLILTQIGKRLAEQADKVTIASEAARELLQSGNKLELTYYKLVDNFAKKQYQSLDEAINYIAQLSELNLVYLMLSYAKIAITKEPAPAPVVKGQSEQKVKSPDKINPSQNSSEDNDELVSKSRIESFIRRAQEYMAKKNFAMAISELRGALKIDPNHSTCHGLLGKAYLEQNQLTMAKVHINKAWKANPKDPVVIECKKLLDKLNKDNKQSKSKSANSDSKGKSKAGSSSGGIFGGLFGTKKK